MQKVLDWLVVGAHWLKESSTVRRIVIAVAVPLLARYGFHFDDASLADAFTKVGDLIGVVMAARAVQGRVDAKGPLPTSRASIPPPTP